MTNFGNNKTESQETFFASYGIMSAIWAALTALGAVIIIAAGEGNTITGFIVPAFIGLVAMNAIAVGVNLVRYGRLYKPKSEIDKK